MYHFLSTSAQSPNLLGRDGTKQTREQGPKALQTVGMCGCAQDVQCQKLDQSLSSAATAVTVKTVGEATNLNLCAIAL